MKGSKFLTELVDCSTFQKGKLNLIEAPTGCGKTYFALKHIPSLVKNPLYKVAFLIDTTNGKEQIMRKYHSAPATLDWQKSVETEMINFADEQHIVAMTYAKFGKMCKENASFIDKLDYIICDEIHNLIAFTHIPSTNNYHVLAKMAIEQVVRGSKATVIALTATPRKVHQWLQCEVNQIEIDKERLVQFETRQTVGYNNLKAVVSQVSKGEVGLCYARQIRKMKEIEAMAAAAGLSPICVWSTNNTEHPMNENQLAARKEILESSAIPPQYNLLIINSSSETSIKIESHVDYVIVDCKDEDSQVQVRGRVNSDLERLYVPSDEVFSLEVKEDFLNRPLFAEDKEALCESLCIYRPGKKEVYKWSGIRKYLLEFGYVLTEGKEKNRHYTIITLPE